MILSPRQTRQVYVVTDKVNEKTSLTATGYTFPKIANGKFYAMYKGPVGPSGNDDGIIFTDRIDLDSIRSVVLSCPAGETKDSWIIDMPATPVTGENYTLYFDFTDWYGVGTDHFYHKWAVAHVTSAITSGDDLANALKTSIEKNFKREAYMPFTVSVTAAVADTSPAKLVITCKEQAFDVLRGIDPTRINCTVSCNKIDNGTSVDYWVPSGTTAGTRMAADSAVIRKNTPVSLGNMKHLAALEYAGLKARADIYGYVGFPNINPSATVWNANDYTGATNGYSLDIRYHLDGQGTNTPNQEKEMTFISKNLTDLVEIMAVICPKTTAAAEMYTASGKSTIAKINSTNIASLSQKDYVVANL